MAVRHEKETADLLTTQVLKTATLNVFLAIGFLVSAMFTEP